MTSFDHDASMHRGADRQKVVEDQYQKFLDFVEENESKGHGLETWVAELHIALLTMLLDQGGTTYPAMIASRERDIRLFVSERIAEIRAFAPMRQEWRYMVVVLSNKLLGTAVTAIAGEFNTWESKTFREKV